VDKLTKGESAMGFIEVMGFSNEKWQESTMMMTWMMGDSNEILNY